MIYIFAAPKILVSIAFPELDKRFAVSKFKLCQIHMQEWV